jgi:hypothetical protein
VLHGNGSTLSGPRPVFLGRRQEHLTNAVTVRMDVSAGVGGLAVRYDERFHLEVEAGGGTVTARVVVADLVQEWTAPLDASVVDLHLDSRKPDPSGGFPRTSDLFHLGFTPAGGERVDLARVDGRFLSSEVAESFTGRVIGVYAVEGDVAVERWVAEGDDD